MSLTLLEIQKNQYIIAGWPTDVHVHTSPVAIIQEIAFLMWKCNWHNKSKIKKDKNWKKYKSR